MKMRVWLLLWILFAFAVRIWRVDAQSLRGDEAFDVLYASQSVEEIIYQDRFNQIYPPFYHVFDHFWLMLAGTSQMSARFIAMAASFLLVPVTYRLGRNLMGMQPAWWGTVLVTVHPFLIWHAQDGRMYTLLAFFSVFAALLAERIWRASTGPSTSSGRGSVYGAATYASSGLPWWLAYIGISTLNILNHYFAYFAVFVINVVALYLWWRRRWRFSVYARWFCANALVGVCGVIWFALAWSRISGHSEPWIAPVSPLDVLTRSALAYTLGTTLEPVQAAPFVAVIIALAAAGAGALWLPATRSGQERERSALAILGTLAILPLVLIYLGSQFRPMYDEKFLIFIVPPLMLLVGRGIAAVGSAPAAIGLLRRHGGASAPAPNGAQTGSSTRRAASLMCAAVVAAGMAWSLSNYHFDARYAKSPPWQEAARVILADARPGDLVITNYPDPSLPYQIGSRLPILLLPAQGPGDPAVAKPLDPQSIEPELARVAAESERVWFVPQTAPNWDRDGVVARLLGRSADRDYEASFGALRLERYLLPKAYQRAWTPLDASFADGVRLRAYRAATTPGQVQLTLFWQAEANPRKDYTVFAHVLDTAGALVAQQDNPPVQGTYATTQWRVGSVVVDRYVIILPTAVPPGDLRFEVGMYDASGTRLRAGTDDKIIFGAFRP